jgi:hypothetical protein
MGKAENRKKRILEDLPHIMWGLWENDKRRNEDYGLLGGKAM